MMCRICNDIVANSLITWVKALASPHASRLGLGLGLAKYNMLGWARARLEITMARVRAKFRASDIIC